MITVYNPSIMSARCRTDILKAYTYFSPASVDVIARIEHMEQIPDVEVYCAQLHEDGLLELAESPNNIVEFQLSSTGRLLVDKNTLNVSQTKYTIYNQLRTKERANALLRNTIYTILSNRNRFICLLEVRSLMNDPISIAELSSVLYGLLYKNKIVVCGPLYGVTSLCI
jgi:hypothetical protein